MTYLDEILKRCAAADQYGPRPKLGQPPIQVAPRYVAELVVIQGYAERTAKALKVAVDRIKQQRARFQLEGFAVGVQVMDEALTEINAILGGK